MLSRVRRYKDKYGLPVNKINKSGAMPFVKVGNIASSSERITIEYYGARIEAGIEDLREVLRAIRDVR